MIDAINKMNQGICPVCHFRNTLPRPGYTRTGLFQCDRCGCFEITIDALLAIDRIDDDVRPIISGWISDENRTGSFPRLDAAALQELSNRRPLRFSEKAKRLLIYFAERTVQYGEWIRIWEPAVESRAQTFDERQMKYIAGYLEEHGWLRRDPSGRDDVYMLTGDGMIKAEDWQLTEARSAQGFVAMWFDASLADAWQNGFQKAIDNAGYNPIRIDTVEHVNKICDEIIVEIRRSRFVVADFTGQRNGVYYEAGYATALNLPVIWTCRKTDLGQLHFDIRQYNCIDWETPENLCARLHARIIALLGEGSRVRR